MIFSLRQLLGGDTKRGVVPLSYSFSPRNSRGTEYASRSKPNGKKRFRQETSYLSKSAVSKLSTYLSASSDGSMQSITLEDPDFVHTPELLREWSPSNLDTAAPYVIPAEDVDEIELTSPVGGGKFGKVYPGLYRGAEVCFKHVEGENINHFLQECDLFFEGTMHPNVTRFYGIHKRDKMWFLTMEYYHDGSILDMFLQKHHKFPFPDLVSLSYQIASGLMHLHRMNIVHADLALRNILVDVSKTKCAITDFGLARRVGNLSQMDTFAPRWASPELICTNVADLESDIWAVGCVFWQLFNEGCKPYPSMSTQTVIKKLSEFALSPEIDEVLHPGIREIFANIFLSKNSRWDAKQVFNAWRKFQKENADGWE